MSVEFNIYLGPYIRATPKMKKQFRADRRCSSGFCKVAARQAGEFCPGCGKAMETYQRDTGYMVPDYAGVDPHVEVDDALVSRFFLQKSTNTSRVEIWLPNGSGPRNFLIESYTINEFPFEQVEHFRKAELVWLNVEHGVHIEILRQHYITVELAWGLLTWAD